MADDFALLRTLDRVGNPLQAFTTNDLGEGGGAGHFYRPLWVVLNQGVVAIFGESATALHALNLVLFAVVVAEVALLARHVVGAAAPIAGLAFALYPRHLESVAWISGNTDLLATALALAALLCALASWPTRRRLAGCAALAAAAGLSKESAFVLPVLAALVMHLAPMPDARSLRIKVPLAMAAGLAAVLAARTVVIGGLGGYGSEAVTVKRLLTATASYLTAAVSPHELELLRRPATALVPLAALVGGAHALRSTRHDPARLRAAVAGLAFFSVALLPVLGQPLDLNDATGERLLFLPSVGLAIAVAALAPPIPGRAFRAALGGAAVVGAALCALGASNWVTAGDIAEDTVLEVVAIGSAAPGRLVALTAPESYRNAHVFTTSLDVAVSLEAGTPVTVALCLPVHIRRRREGAVRVAPDGAGWKGTASSDAPFDLPLTGAPSGLSPGCRVERVTGQGGVPGLPLRARALPHPAPGQVRFAFFDGSRMRVLRGGAVK